VTEFMDAFSHFDFATLPQADKYKLLASTIMPRPIAWVTSRDAAGVLNAAPYSFFNVVSADPPLVAISFTKPPDREKKDTMANIQARGQFVVNMVSEELAEAMNVTATNAPIGMDETQLAGLSTLPCEVVDIPRIEKSPVAFECELVQMLNFGGASTICLGRVVYAHVKTEAFEDLARLHINAAKLELIGRMHGAGGYTTTRGLFHIERKSWPLE
jgi:flavin reductase (DIM6/NTAB) family NADH-FMN oxidoreductase RutF